MISQHNEIEAKLPADGVDIEKFKTFCREFSPDQFKFIDSPDFYYRQNKNVVRHRVNSETSHELTVKRRKSDSSTLDRLEIDLKFADSTYASDVTAFLKATGFELEFSLRKEAHIFWFTKGSTHISVVIYDVFCEGFRTRRFIEVEAEKGSDVTVAQAKQRVKQWVGCIQEEFEDAQDPINQSLYEIYSGNTYQSVECKTT